MKTLLLIRHAKSSLELDTTDFDRPLNKRGKADAPMMAKRLHNKMTELSIILSSPAVRAFTTAKYFAEEYGIRNKDIIVVPLLYLAKPEVYKTVIEVLDDALTHVAIFGHNPGITDFANSLTNVQVDDMPTCAIYTVQSMASKWKYFLQETSSFQFFDYPKIS